MPFTLQQLQSMGAKAGSPAPASGNDNTSNQTVDLGLKTLADKTGFANTPIGKAGKASFDFLTNSTQALGENLGASSLAPENINKYSNALSQYSDLNLKLIKQIQQDKSAGKDTSGLQATLKNYKKSMPKMSNFLDATTIKRLNDGFGKNLEEVLGQGIGTGLEALSGGALESGIETATEKGTSLGSKILKGAKIGAKYGVVGGLSSGLSQKGNATDVAKSTVTGGILGAGLGVASEAVAGVTGNLIKGRPAFGSLASVPEKLAGEEGALSNISDAKNQVLEAQKLTKENIKNPDLPSASDVQGNRVHQVILTKAKTQLDAIGTKMSDSLANPAVGSANTDLSGITSSFEADLSKRPPVSTNGDNRVLNDFNDDLAKLSGTGESKDTYQGQKIITDKSTGARYIFSKDGEPIPVPKSGSNITLTDVDNFLRKWQKIDASNSMQNNSVGALIDSTVHNINELAKTTADKAETAAGVTGHPYRESNDEYSKLISDYNDAKDQLGVKRVSTGQYDKSGSVYRANATVDSSPAWKNLAKATDVSLGQRASITKTIEDIYNKENPYDAIKNARFSPNITMEILRNFQSMATKAKNDPDAIVKMMIQTIEDSQGNKLPGTINGIKQ